MPRGKYYSEELREEARRLRREGWSLGEISAKLGPPKNTLTLWVRGVELSPEQRVSLKEREAAATARNQVLAAKAHRRAKLERLDAARDKAQVILDKPHNPHLANHIAAAMLYLGEGAKADGVMAFANSNPQVIRYWLYLLRTSFAIDEGKLRLQLMYRADQNVDELMLYWSELTGVSKFIRGSMDPRTLGKPTKRLDYKGVCSVVYYDVALRHYLDALAHELMTRAVGADKAP